MSPLISCNSGFVLEPTPWVYTRKSKKSWESHWVVALTIRRRKSRAFQICIHFYCATIGVSYTQLENPGYTLENPKWAERVVVPAIRRRKRSAFQLCIHFYCAIIGVSFTELKIMKAFRWIPLSKIIRDKLQQYVIKSGGNSQGLPGWIKQLPHPWDTHYQFSIISLLSNHKPQLPVQSQCHGVVRRRLPVLVKVATCHSTPQHRDTAENCNTATSCNTLQYTAGHSRQSWWSHSRSGRGVEWVTVLCNTVTLQKTAILQHAATRCSTLQDTRSNHDNNIRGHGLGGGLNLSQYQKVCQKLWLGMNLLMNVTPRLFTSKSNVMVCLFIPLSQRHRTRTRPGSQRYHCEDAER